MFCRNTHKSTKLQKLAEKKINGHAGMLIFYRTRPRICKSGTATVNIYTRYCCSHALFTLGESVKYFIKRGSKTHCVSLDASKAFDKVLHNGLFVKMLNRGIPVSLVRILVFWYNDLSLAVIWNGVTGEYFKAVCGVRQGGELSYHPICIHCMLMN